MNYKVIYRNIGSCDYKEAWDLQTSVFDELVNSKRERKAQPATDSGYIPGTLLFTEHPHVYTLGRSGSEDNLLAAPLMLRAKNASFYKTDRGGDITYHGPGQLVGYPVFDLERIGIGLKEYIYNLEEAIIKSLNLYGITGGRLNGATGVWIDADSPRSARKICAIGVKASRFITMHGFALNVNTDLSYFSLINPCGFTDKGVTSMEKELGRKIDFEEVSGNVKNSLSMVFDLDLIN